VFFNAKNGIKGELFAFSIHHLAATVKAAWAYVVAQMRFTCGWLYCQWWIHQKVVRAVHATF
jgi:hypothetical protein